MIPKTWFLNHESPGHLLNIFQPLNKRKKQWHNAGKTAVISPKTFYRMLVTFVYLLGITKA